MPTYSVEIAGTSLRFDARDDQTVLESARAAGVPIASSCRTGTCRTCLRRALAGKVRYQIEWPGVSPDEKQAGYFLPCVAYPASDLVIGDGIVKPWWD